MKAQIIGSVMAAGTLGISGVAIDAEHPSKIRAAKVEMSLQSFAGIEAAATEYHVENNAMPTDMTTLVTEGLYTGRQSTVASRAFSTTVQGDGTLVIEGDVGDPVVAKMIANKLGSSSVNGTIVRKVVAKPQHSALKATIMREFVDVSEIDRIAMKKDMDMAGKSIFGVNTLEADSLFADGVQLGSVALRNGGDALILDASTTQTNGELLVSGQGRFNSVATEQATIENGQFADLKAEVAEVDNLMAQMATVTEADITQLTATRALLQEATAETLKVAGLTELSELVAADAKMDTITGGALRINGEAIVELLKAQGFQVTNAVISQAEVTNLIANLATLAEVEADLVDSARVEADSLHAAVATIGELEVETANVTDLVALEADLQTLRTELAEIEEASINVLNVMDKANLGEATATSIVTMELQADKASLGVATADSLQVAGEITTQTLVVEQDATFNNFSSQSVTAGVVDASVVNVDGTANIKRAEVEQDVQVGGTVRARTASVSGSASVGGNLSAQNAEIAGTATARTGEFASVEADNATLGNASAGSVSASTVKVSGKVTAGSAQVTSATFGSVSAGSIIVSNRATVGELVSTGLAQLNRVKASTLDVTTLKFGSASGSSLSLSGTLSASTGRYSNLDVSGKGTFGSIDASSATLGSLTVNGLVKGNSMNLSGDLSAYRVSANQIQASTVNASSTITGSDIRTASGVSLNSYVSKYSGHDGRITNMETWIAKCKNKQVSECNR